MERHFSRSHGYTIAFSVVRCDTCGKAFRRKPRQEAEKYDIHFCSEDCRFSDPETHPMWEGGKVEVECCVCGEKLSRKPYKLNRSDKFFCGQGCYGEWRSANWEGESHPRWSGRVSITCENCGGRFERPPSVAETAKFCSVGCREDAHSDLMSGDGNPSWVGGSGKIDYGPSWKGHRRKALERDSYTCQSCGAGADDIGRNPDVHHIVPFRRFDDHIQANELSNLVCLCPSCHRQLEGLSKGRQEVIVC